VAAGAAAGRKSTPAHLKLIGGRGNGKDSGGRNVPEPPPFARDLPVKPDDLSPAASRMWDAILVALPAAGLLKQMDGFALQVGCETWARWYEAKKMRLAQPGSGLLSKNSQGLGVSPLVRIESEASRDFRAWCSEFGLTPAAEVKLAAAGEGGSDGDLF
jgi:P27 family predicted phage terminase small subunit